MLETQDPVSPGLSSPQTLCSTLSSSREIPVTIYQNVTAENHTFSKKKKKKGCSFSSIFPNPFSLSRIRSSQQKASPATGWWKDEMSSCWLPSGIDLLLPACGTQYLKGVDGWMLKWIMYRLYEKWLGSSLFFFLNEELVFIYKLLYCQMPIKLNPAARMTRS